MSAPWYKDYDRSRPNNKIQIYIVKAIVAPGLYCQSHCCSSLAKLVLLNCHTEKNPWKFLGRIDNSTLVEIKPD